MTLILSLYLRSLERFVLWLAPLRESWLDDGEDF